MDEPMQQGNDLGESIPPNVGASTSGKLPLKSSGLNFQMMTVNEYETECWPVLENAITQLLTVKFGKLIPLSYEQMYSCVYRCVCRGQPERLYKDTMALVSSHLDSLAAALKEASSPQLFITQLQQHLEQYDQALSGVVPIFNYMNRFYVESRLHTTLQQQLKQLFSSRIVEPNFENIITLLRRFDSEPFSVSPDVVSSIVKNLHALKSEYSQTAPELFSRYVPELVPRTSHDQLLRYQEETHFMQQELVANGFARGDQSRKRAGDDEFQEDNQRTVKR